MGYVHSAFRLRMFTYGCAKSEIYKTTVQTGTTTMETWNELTSYVSTIPPAIQILLIIGCVFVIRKLLRPKKEEEEEGETTNSLPPMKKRDFTISELLEYDGVKNERVLLAVCGKVFDVTKGKSFYGPGMFFCCVIYLFCI